MQHETSARCRAIRSVKQSNQARMEYNRFDPVSSTWGGCMFQFWAWSHRWMLLWMSVTPCDSKSTTNPLHTLFPLQHSHTYSYLWEKIMIMIAAGFETVYASRGRRNFAWSINWSKEVCWSDRSEPEWIVVHYGDVIIGAIASQITSLTIVYSAVYSDADHRKIKLRVTGLCTGNSPGTGEFPVQMANNAESVSIWWRQHVGITLRYRL